MPDDEVVVLEGDFEGEPWCLSVSDFGDKGVCLSLSVDGATEAGRLHSSSGTLGFGDLDWYATGNPEWGVAVYGHAPANATKVRLVDRKSASVVVAVGRSPHVDDATFFAVRVPEGFFPQAATALADDVEIQRRDAPIVRLATDS